jgi:hypothetical protein
MKPAHAYSTCVLNGAMQRVAAKLSCLSYTCYEVPGPCHENRKIVDVWVFTRALHPVNKANKPLKALMA